jgi:outer membrane lipoprotein SlyB
MRIKVNVLTWGVAVSAVLLTGCQYPNGEPNNTASGALIGGAMGAIAGAAIGGPRNGGAGALIGAAAGAITGGVIGNSMDQEQEAELRAQAPQTYVRVQQGQPLSVSDIKALAAANVSDDVIISQIRNSHTVFHLSTSDIIDLHNAGVSENVINFMINTPGLVGDGSSVQTTTVVTEAPPPPPVETVVLAPGPGYVWVGGDWVWNGRWVWRAGYWAYPPYPRAVWVGGYWGRGPHGWYRREGHWR